MQILSTRRRLGSLLLASWLTLLATAALAAPPLPPPPIDAGGDDLFLIQASVAPNVILLMDNSRSMNHIEWHPAFDPNADPASYGCADFDNSTSYEYTSNTNENHCGSGNRTIYGPNNPTLWDGRYLNWFFGLPSNSPILDEIKLEKANVAGCTQAGGGKFFDEKYRRTRLEASKQVLIDLLCVAEPKNVRFGLAYYRTTEDAADEDPNGGYIPEDLGRSNPNHSAQLEAAIKNTDVNDDDVEATPLSETLFQLYTFWMSRDLAHIPVGEDGLTQFPRYQYAKDGDWENDSSKWLEDPMLYECEKAFVVVVTDGLSTRDDFDTEDVANTATGFVDFTNLIGNYHADGEMELPGAADEGSFYLDDIAKYMYEHDFRPDLVGDQTIDTYTIGLATDSTTDAFLGKTAQVGNGFFRHVKDGDELTFALIEALNDIIEKAASFTAATVPAARTRDGADFYQSYFVPRGKSAFWEGHVRSWLITASGDIHDKNDVCALDDPQAGECNSGPFKPDAEFFWDAADHVDLPPNRDLYVSLSPSAGSLPPVFASANLAAADLLIDPFAVAGDPAPNSALYAINGSNALTEEGLADEVVQYARGCFFGTGVTDVTLTVTPGPCLALPSRLGDVFHSNPVVVRRPALNTSDPSYNAFKSHYGSRTRVLYAGTNAGFLEALHAGTWQGGAIPPKYDAGTGSELFGFMPWEARLKIKNFPIDPATSRSHYVDGDVSFADVWFHSSPTTGTKLSNGSEWHTVIVGSLREGGHHYYALDVTNPDGISHAGGGGAIPYPAYLWEFPTEADPDGDLAFMGETWGEAVITKVKLRVGANDNSGAGYERWVAIVTAGYDSVSDPNPDTVTTVTSSYDASGGSGKQGRGIYIIDVKTGEVLAEQVFDAAASDARADMEFNLVASPTVLDLNSDGFADVIYAADTGGQIFKWVINAIGEDRVNDTSGLRTQPSWPFKLFFDAGSGSISGDTYYRNFFFSPAAAYAEGKLFLAFGSGERRSLPWEGVAGDDAENNRFYVVTDLDPFEQLVLPLPTITEAGLTEYVTEGANSFAGSGYFFKIGDGEKFVTNIEMFNGNVIAASFVPTTSANPCTTRGEGALYIFDLLTGEGKFQDPGGNPDRSLSIGTGLPTDPKISVGVGGKDSRVIIEKSGADLITEDAGDVNVGGDFLYWRETF